MFGNFCTVGHFTALFQRSPREIKTALEELGIKPALALNDLNYFKSEDLETAIKFINLGSPEPTGEVIKDAE